MINNRVERPATLPGPDAAHDVSPVRSSALLERSSDLLGAADSFKAIHHLAQHSLRRTGTNFSRVVG